MRWSDTISRFLAARRKAPEFEVNLRRIFILPTRHGMMVAISIIGVFAIAVRIQNNMLLLMAIALFVIFVLSLLWAGDNMRGVRTTAVHQSQLVAGETVLFTVRLDGRKLGYDLYVDAGEGDQPATVTSAHALTYTPEIRGRQYLPTVRVSTQFPFGLARAWAWICPAEILVAPKPDYAAARALLTGMTSRGQDDGNDSDGADSLQDWVPGTPETRISWKQYAATDRLLEKTGDHSGGAVLDISYDLVAHLGHEQALSAMSAAVLRAVRAGRPFHFRLHGLDLRYVDPQSAGRALDALALA